MSLLRLDSRMSRPIRIEFAEAVYHIMARGNQGQKIYADDGDRNPKGQLEKRVLAWWVYGHTTVTRGWIAENLRMGYESGVSRAVSFVESSAANEVMTMKSKLRNTDVR